jgi:pyruvate,water dikinase
VDLRAFAARVLGRPARPRPALDARLASFREVLQANNAALGHIARIQQALAGDFEPTATDVRRLLTSVTVQTYRMVVHLNLMTNGACRNLVPVFDRLKATLQQRADVRPVLTPAGLVVPLSKLGRDLAEQVGQKSANLGEARRVLGERVPDGFATTADAYHAFVSGRLAARVAKISEGLDAGDVAGCFEASAAITGLIENAEVPDELAVAITRAVSAFGPDDVRCAVRSSALHEGGPDMSFAGQYRSLLNVPRHGVVDAFRRVVASKYSAQAIVYRLSRGYRDGDVAMCCCVVRMIDAAAAGVLYSAYEAGDRTTALLQAVRGLGLSAVDGSAEPDSYRIDRTHRAVVERKRGHQQSLLRMAPGEGTERQDVEKTVESDFVLSRDQAVAIASYGWRLEDALGSPVDMEWAIDRSGSVFVLQVRPQPTHGENAAPRRERLPGVPVLWAGGSRVCGGAASGPVHRVSTDLDLLRCPPGAVVVTSEANPRLAVLLPTAAAIIAELGEVTGHLATVARELKVPALFAARSAISALPPGVIVTVDADAAVVYAGRVEVLLASTTAGQRLLPANPHRDALASVAELIVPLTLTDSRASGYTAERCRTLHDVIRFCHQATIEAMFDLGDGALRRGEPLRRLVSDVPIDCRLVDLGGGIRQGAPLGAVTLDDVVCRPMRALWRGMTDPRQQWRVTKSVSVTGFVSALVNYGIDPDQPARGLGEPSYVFVTHDYCNLNSRVGYHFSTVDARIGDLVESNYASMRFVGGSTGIDQRSRRAALIERVLVRKGFETDCRADLVNARVRHRPADEMEDAVLLIGLLLGYVNHLDMVLTSDAVMQDYADAFLAGDYAFKRRSDHA